MTWQPKALKPKHMTLAMLVAVDTPDAVIAKELGLSKATVRAVKRSPLCALEVQRLKRQQGDAASKNYVDQVMDDGDKNVKFLKAVRDGKIIDEADSLRIRMDASKTLFDRQMPKQKEGQVNNAGVTIVFQQSEQRAMAEAARDAGVMIPHLDDVIAEFEAVEAVAAARADD